MTGQWRISRVEVSHSHLLNLKLSGMFSANRQLSMHVKDLIQQNDQAGIRPSKTYQALANAVGGLANLTFTENDVKSYISRHLRISGDETDPKDLLKHFSRMKELNPNFFFEIDVDKNHSIRNVFWADAQCRAAWEYFGDVVTFDTTYKTNRYDMPFGSFIGVNHHGMSMLLGCTLLRNEDTHKEQKELERDAADLRGIIHCVSSSPIEKQFQREYTNSMFRDVQDQFIKKADCDISSVNHHGTSIVCEVDQQKMVFDMSVYSRYQVMYCSQSSDVQCDCFMFQSNGILCCHSLAVLLHFHVTVVSSQYILSRWSKNVSRRHTYIRSSIDMDRSDESMTIFRQLCSDFYNVAQDFVATPEVAAILRDAMDNARQKLKEHKESEHQAAHVPSAIYSHTRDECPVSMDELHGPRRVPTRGRPTSTRLGADIEKSIKKRARKNKNTHNHNKVNMRSTPFFTSFVYFKWVEWTISGDVIFQYDLRVKGLNGNAQPYPPNVTSSYKDTQRACSKMTNNLATHSGSFISLLNSFHNAEQLCMCT
ncbi:hypothetical protein Ahy_B10g102887 [Arachis hypogaea]|uniref:SWIM-type domain-containing protein n=1 Tax=Arachis hypogaea TaxID=3818 RepID=A0A444X2P1_ARAHY|nr:hypothetical protein Ahy_B10g102887 [Arachis hypogaea]